MFFEQIDFLEINTAQILFSKHKMKIQNIRITNTYSTNHNMYSWEGKPGVLY